MCVCTVRRRKEAAGIKRRRDVSPDGRAPAHSAAHRVAHHRWLINPSQAKRRRVMHTMRTESSRSRRRAVVIEHLNAARRMPASLPSRDLILSYSTRRLKLVNYTKMCNVESVCVYKY